MNPAGLRSRANLVFAGVVVLLLLVGMYLPVIDAGEDRDLVVLATFAVGAVVGLASFSTLLNWLLQRAHDLVLAVLIGLMVGSVRVLWPWPPGEDGVGGTELGAPVAAEVPAALAAGLAHARGSVIVSTPFFERALTFSAST